MTELSADTIFNEDVVEQLTRIMQTAKPFNDFLRRALT